MRKIFFSKAIRKDLIRLRKRGAKSSKLERVIDVLKDTGGLPSSFQPHKLHGEWTGKWECHIEHDWLLIYAVEESAVYLYRSGSHPDLFE